MDIIRDGISFTPSRFRIGAAGSDLTRIPLHSKTMVVLADISIEWRGDDRWCIFNGTSCYNKLGEWEYEPRPSSRSDEYLERARYTLDEALTIAAKIVKDAVRDDVMKEDDRGSG
jgi:hypothetical protein